MQCFATQCKGVAGQFLLDWTQTIGRKSEGMPKTFKRVGINKTKNRMKKLMMLGLIFLGLNLGTGLNAQSDCDLSCIDWYLVVTDNSGRVLSETFLYTTCNGKESLSACEESGGQAKIILTQDQASCNETWQLLVVMSHEQNVMCGAYVKAMGKVSSAGRGNWKARAYLDKHIGAHLIAGTCETAFYSINDHSFVSRANEPNVLAGFFADIGFGVNITISGGEILRGEGTVWFDAAELSTFKNARFQNPLCW